ncbi:alpha/beta-hydrolase [Meira miltonrushii]|uniref:Prolyl endopeptidase n=1 Tax=Meira miltonrushii TaxID=1280837 RepID=A0A316VHL5_9BASI|nr:alpha/beta-hydrolase [Meira miltonrushii]PWN34995.1 alpha/beta-hydrolase [Meira miltonrushii]
MRLSVRTLVFVATLIALVVWPIEGNNHKHPSARRLVYPPVRRVNQTWSYRSAKTNGNVTFDDPYYWLEGSNDDKDIQQFIADQSNVTETYMQGCKEKDAILKSLTEASTYDRYNDVELIEPNKGGNPFYIYSLIRAGDQPPVWYTASVAEFKSGKKINFETPPGKPFLNETLLSPDGTDSILYHSTSPDGKIFGYLVVGNGEVGTWYFRRFDSPLVNVKTRPSGGEGRLNDTLLLSSDAILWTPDSGCIFYSQTVNSNGGTNTDLDYKIRYHAWGTDNTNDITVFDGKNAGELGILTYFFAFLSNDGRWLIISGSYEVTTENMVSYATLLEVINNTFYIKTNKDAKNLKVSKIHLDWNKAKQVKDFTELQDRPEVIDVIPERNNASITPFDFGPYMIAQDKIAAVYVENGQYTLYVYHAEDGRLIQRLIPDAKGRIFQVTGNQDSTTLIVAFTTWNHPRVLYEFVVNDDHVDTSIVTAQRITGANPDDFTIEEIYATSKDGTKVPYFITYRKGTRKDGKSPLWLHAYGGYGIVDNLYYKPSYFDFLRSYDGYFVWGSPRGGGDKGGDWHDAATGLKKQKTFDDTLAILNSVVALKYTSPGMIIVEGVSGGGMLFGAVTNQAAQGLIGVSLLVRAPLDIFEFELRNTIGAFNREELGDVTTPEGFDAVFAWSPYQNIDPHKSYPAVFLTPGTGDERVPPSHSYKFLSKLQYLHPNNKSPLLMYVQKDKKGHIASTAEENIYQFCIIEESLGISRRKM